MTDDSGALTRGDRVTRYYREAFAGVEVPAGSSRLQFPYVGPGYDAAARRVVFVGKAPAGWGRGPKLAGLSDSEWVQRGAEETREFVEETVLGDKYGSSWWRQLRALADRLFPGGAGLTSVAYTNLFKACTGERNPSRELRQSLLDGTRPGWLAEELEILEPHLLVFFCRRYAGQLRLALPELAVQERPGVPWAQGSYRGATAFLARHPQYWRAEGPAGFDAFGGDLLRAAGLAGPGAAPRE